MCRVNTSGLCLSEHRLAMTGTQLECVGSNTSGLCLNMLDIYERNTVGTC